MGIGRDELGASLSLEKAWFAVRAVRALALLRQGAVVDVESTGSRVLRYEGGYLGHHGEGLQSLSI